MADRIRSRTTKEKRERSEEENSGPLRTKTKTSTTIHLKLKSKALKGKTQKWFISGEGYKDPWVFLSVVRPDVEKLLDNVKEYKKVSLKLDLELEKVDMKTGEAITDTFGAETQTHDVDIQLGNTYDEMVNKITERLAKFQKNGSGWRLKAIDGLVISIVKCNPLKGGKYSELSKFIKNKKAVINMKNKDNTCFLWCATRALNPTDHNAERVSEILKKQSEKYNWEGITFPTKVKDIDVWEKNNDINVHVVGYDDKEIYPIRKAKLDKKKVDNTIILYLHDHNHYYCVVKDLSRLVSSVISKNRRPKLFCMGCLNPFRSEEVLSEHEKDCSGENPQRGIFPDEGSTTKFKNYERVLPIPISFHADFECFLEPVTEGSEEKDPNKSYTTKYHKPFAFGYVRKCMDESVLPTEIVIETAKYEGQDMGKEFIESLIEETKLVYEKLYKNPKPMVMSEADKKHHSTTKNCYACKAEFGTKVINDEGEVERATKCRDHCHVTERYRGAACVKCNLRMKIPKFIPVLFHGLENYDTHLFVKSLGLSEGEIKCIPKTDEKYISFSKNIPVDTYITNDGKEKTIYLELRFLHSFKFKSGSLDSLSKNAKGQPIQNTHQSNVGRTRKPTKTLKEKRGFPLRFYDRLL